MASLSLIPSSTWVRVNAPLMPEVAFVEFPPKKPVIWLAMIVFEWVAEGDVTLLIENDDVAAVLVDGMSGAQARHCKRAHRSAIIHSFSAFHDDQNSHPPPTTITFAIL